MGDEDKTEPLEQLKLLGERLAEQDRILQKARDEYENACAVFDLHIKKLKEQKAAATQEPRDALDLRTAAVEATKLEILQAWVSQEELPKTLETEAWRMQLRINKVLEVHDPKMVMVRLTEIGKYDTVVKHTFDKRVLRKLVEADLFKDEVTLEERPSLVFKVV